MKFHEKLQKLRKEKGLSQEGLAEVLAVSRQAISKWESGQSYPETEKLIALSEIFGVTLDSLIKQGDTQQDISNTVSDPFWTHRGNYYEYKSSQTLFGLPLVHINIGRGLRQAKGILAIGNAAKGVVAFGLFSVGVLSGGVLSVGLISLGALSVGALLSLGAISVGAIAIGAVAVGAFTVGALSVGTVSIGACSVGNQIAIGDYAKGHIAIGRIVDGVKMLEVRETSRIFVEVTKEQVRTLIQSEFPDMWRWVANVVIGLFR